MKVLIEGRQRAKVLRYVSRDKFFEVEVEELVEHEVKNAQSEAMLRAVKEAFEAYVKLNKRIPPEMLMTISAIETTSKLWKSTDGGSSWVQVNANLGANARTLGLWPYNSDYIYMALRASGPYFSTNGGVSFASKAGNWTTAIGSIGLGIQLVPVWTV